MVGGVILEATISQMEIRIMQYENLRKCFNALIDSAFGENYYNLGMDVYSCDNLCCQDLAKKIGKECYKRYKTLTSD